jgi:hypothetical protein
MSLGLFAAIVVELERMWPEAASVDQLASYAAVSQADVRAMLLDIRAQGRCRLIKQFDQITAAVWLPEAPCA